MDISTVYLVIAILGGCVIISLLLAAIVALLPKPPDSPQLPVPPVLTHHPPVPTLKEIIEQKKKRLLDTEPNIYYYADADRIFDILHSINPEGDFDRMETGKTSSHAGTEKKSDELKASAKAQLPPLSVSTEATTGKTTEDQQKVTKTFVPRKGLRGRDLLQCLKELDNKNKLHFELDLYQPEHEVLLMAQVAGEAFTARTSAAVSGGQAITALTELKELSVVIRDNGDYVLVDGFFKIKTDKSSCRFTCKHPLSDALKSLMPVADLTIVFVLLEDQLDDPYAKQFFDENSDREPVPLKVFGMIEIPLQGSRQEIKLRALAVW